MNSITRSSEPTRGDIVHHPAIARISAQTRTVPAGSFIEFGGAITRSEWVPVPPAPPTVSDAVCESPATPVFDEEYFEWIDLVEAVEQADGGHVVIAEFGAGYGRWSVRGALLARAVGLDVHCIAVEADPTHARWLRQHFIDNGLKPDQHELLWAAVGAEAGFVPFRMAKASTEYGQHVAQRSDAAYPTVAERRRLRARAALGRPPHMPSGRQTSMWVPCVSLTEVLAPYPIVDLIDMDVQGAELGVLRAAMHSVNTRVRRVHVGTHGREIESGLRQLFTEHGWQPLHDYPCQSVTETAYGPIRFVDGVQSWVNPEIGARKDAAEPGALRGDTDAVRLAERVRALKNKVGRLKTEREELLRRIKPVP